MKINLKDQGRPVAQTSKPAPQLALRTNLHAGKDAGCEEGISYWRKEFNYWKNLAKTMGCA